MQINVAQLLKEDIGSSRIIDVNQNVGYEDKETFYVHGKVILTRINKGILASGKIIGLIKGNCNRCLAPVTKEIEFDFEEEFLPTIDILTGLPLYVHEDEFKIDAKHILDLDDALYQNVCLSIPMKILCKDNCAGICPTCGKNLNEGNCDCHYPKIDKRWFKLVQIRKEGKL